MPNAVHSHFTVERHYSHSAERVFAALADPLKRRRWYAEGDQHDIELFEFDLRPGGIDRLRYRFRADSPFPGLVIANEGRFEDIVPAQRIVTSGAMSFEGRRISVSVVTIELAPAHGGTDLICTFQGVFFEGADGPDIRRMGWETMLDALGRELEA